MSSSTSFGYLRHCICGVSSLQAAPSSRQIVSLSVPSYGGGVLHPRTSCGRPSLHAPPGELGGIGQHCEDGAGSGVAGRRAFLGGFPFLRFEKSWFRYGADTYAAVLQILFESGRSTKLCSLLSEMVSARNELRFELPAVLDALMRRYDGYHVCVRVLGLLVNVYVELGMLGGVLGLFLCASAFGFDPRERSCNFLLNHLVDRCNSAMARAFLAQLLKTGFVPTVCSFSILIKSYCKDRKWEEAMNVLKEMEALGIKADDSVYTTLIDGFCVYSGADTGYSVLQMLGRFQIQTCAFGYNLQKEETAGCGSRIG